MKRIILLLLPALLIISCDKDDDEKSERFMLLTGPTWASDSLLVNGVDAGGPSGLLENFNGEAKFNEDGTGNFGSMTGSWQFMSDETQLRISTTSYPFPIMADIRELTGSSLKITTLFPNPENLQETLNIRMTFRAR